VSLPFVHQPASLTFTIVTDAAAWSIRRPASSICWWTHSSPRWTRPTLNSRSNSVSTERKTWMSRPLTDCIFWPRGGAKWHL
jgi:hypothetical protein